MADKSANVDDRLDEILNRYDSIQKPVPPGADGYKPPVATYYKTKEVRSTSFDAEKLQNVVSEIKVIEDGIKSIIASRTKKVIEEKVPVQKQRPIKHNAFDKALVSLGLKKQKTEAYTDYEIVKKEIPRQPDEVLVSDFRGMIEDYINSLKGLNEGLRETVTEVDSIVKNLTEVSDTFTDQIHRDRRAYDAQIKYSKELETQLKEVTPIHESMSPIHEKYAEVEKMKDHIEMALRESQGMELKYKTNIDMGVKYQTALKSYRTLINDFKERGDIHVNMVDKFADGASHMKIAVDNVSQICSGVAKVTQSMIMIVESIDDGNRVLGRYASLIGDQIASSPRWEMEYNALQEAEETYKKNDQLRLEQIKDNRQEIESLIDNKAGS
ncbi:hypothetical protein QUF80_12485 [Desulfococcaceae bacterium HSG8]|nr:hypothetical protein [Desulfococcaceae bacterium HSG8]